MVSVSNIVMMGNPGAGKSTILSTIAGRAIFPSGLSRRHGLTKNSTSIEIPRLNSFVTDTPGMGDLALIKHACKEVTTALNLGDHFRVVFVVCPEAGRLTTLDIIVIATVLAGLQSAGYNMAGNYGLIVNKLSKKLAKEFKTHGMNDLFQQYAPVVPPPNPENICYVLKDGDAFDEDNAILASQAEDIVDAINRIPIHTRRQEQIQIDYDGLERQIRAVIGIEDRPNRGHKSSHKSAPPPSSKKRCKEEEFCSCYQPQLECKHCHRPVEDRCVQAKSCSGSGSNSRFDHR